MTLPPLHPRCRCAISYREVGNEGTRNKQNNPVIDGLAAPPKKPAGIVSPPFSLGTCKTFEEFKLYWAENHNVKVSDEIGKLDFESVQTAAAGIEAVLKEFPQAGFYLKEFNVLRNSAIMSTARGLGRINFNPEYFTNGEVLAATIAAGVKSKFYPKNMTAFGAGAHEATHIVEDWLIAKYRSVHTEYRPIPRRLVREAYRDAQLAAEGKGKSLETLKKEIAIYALENDSECLASGAADYMTNGADSNILSRMIWQRIKEELVKMLAPGKSKFWQYPAEYIMEYCLFEDGCIAGIKDEAPNDFKKAYEEHKKLEKEMWEQGIDG